MHLTIDQRIRKDFPGLKVPTIIIKDLGIKNEDPYLEPFRKEIIQDVRSVAITLIKTFCGGKIVVGE